MIKFRLEREETFYEAHKEEFRKQYAGKYIVIIGEKLIGAYDTLGEAREEGSRRSESGLFMMRPVHENPEEDTVLILPFILHEMVC